MKLNDILALVRAGYTRDEIQAMEQPAAAPDPQPAAAPDPQPAAAPDPQPAAAPDPRSTAEQVPRWATVLVQQLQQQQRQLEQMSVRSTGQPQGVMLTPEEYAQQSLRSLAGMPADDNK